MEIKKVKMPILISTKELFSSLSLLNLVKIL